MRDPRVEAYAKLLVERCIDPKPGWQVMVLSTPLARPAVEAVERELARRGAYALLRLDFAMESFPLPFEWATEAPEEIVGELAPIERYAVDHIDARITIEAPENTRYAAAVPPERYALIRRAVQPYYKRSMSLEIPWVSCQFPTPALAQDAGMSLRAFEDFFYGACLRDWDEETRKLRRIADRFDRSEEIRIVADGTDLTLSIAGRTAQVDEARVNIPGGEIFYCPVEDSASGTISYSEFPAVLNGCEVGGVRLRFEAGIVVDASASSNETFLLRTLDTDEGARRVGERGIGCNLGIQRHLRNVLFDDKMDVPIHFGLGHS